MQHQVVGGDVVGGLGRREPVQQRVVDRQRAGAAGGRAKDLSQPAGVAHPVGYRQFHFEEIATGSPRRR
ncbi:hypothetical protein, partial [Nocardia abscessus]|uniref:hypothetical protein n=1 Tax=Nocardia abscessus TaxID=120957 RepID=UPI002455D4D7